MQNWCIGSRMADACAGTAAATGQQKRGCHGATARRALVAHDRQLHERAVLPVDAGAAEADLAGGHLGHVRVEPQREHGRVQQAQVQHAPEARRPPEALDRLGRARPCDARPRLSAEAAERAACGHCAADAAPAAADAHLATWRRWRCCAACAYMGCERQGRTKMPSQEAASKSGDAWLARPNVCAGSSSGGCASVSVSCASLPLTVPVPYFMVKAAAAPCKGRRNRGQAGVSGWRSDPRCTPPHPRPHRLPRQAHLLEGAAGVARKARMRTARRRLAVVGRQPAHVHYA